MINHQNSNMYGFKIGEAAMRKGIEKKKEIYMKFFNLINIILISTAFNLSALADPASDDAKLALLLSNAERLNAVEISAFDLDIKNEKHVPGEEGSATIVTVGSNQGNRTYIFNRDGSGEIVSVQMMKAND